MDHDHDASLQKQFLASKRAELSSVDPCHQHPRVLEASCGHDVVTFVWTR
jgi:hypothetical protein